MKKDKRKPKKIKQRKPATRKQIIAILALAVCGYIALIILSPKLAFISQKSQDLPSTGSARDISADADSSTAVVEASTEASVSSDILTYFESLEMQDNYSIIATYNGTQYVYLLESVNKALLMIDDTEYYLDGTLGQITVKENGVTRDLNLSDDVLFTAEEDLDKILTLIAQIIGSYTQDGMMRINNIDYDITVTTQSDQLHVVASSDFIVCDFLLYNVNNTYFSDTLD